MADSIKITTVATSIAALSITVTNALGSSVTVGIKDISAVPEAVNQQDCPMLAPRPQGFVTDFGVTRDAFGADAAPKTVAYTLHYVFFYAPVMQGVGLLEKYDEMVTAAAVVLNHLATNTALSGTTDILPGNIPVFGPVADVTGQQFHGCEIEMRVIQFMET